MTTTHQYAGADLFTEDAADKSVEQQHSELEPHERAILAIERALRAKKVLQCSWSSGKDSSAVANLMFNAALNILKEGLPCPQLVISHSDTGVENPVVRAIADGELAKMRAFADKHGIPLDIRIGKPTLNANFATRIIGGRALPPFPQGRADCSTDWKVMVGQRIAKDVARNLPADGPPVVTLLGTRSDESAARKIKTAARRETAHEIWYNVTGDARLSPILDWTTDDVWTWLAESAQGFHPSYSDFQAIMDFYSDSGASSCVIVADMQSAASNKGCGGRSGCWTCTRVAADKSVENMLQANPGKYPYLEPLLALRDFIADTQWDWSRRNFLGRTITDGHMKVGADQYSPKMCEDLLYYTLAAQSRANELGAPARVAAIGIKELIAIDALWALRGWAPPFHALSIYFDHCDGNRRYAPKIKNPCRPSPVPVLGQIYVGEDWDSNVSQLTPPGFRHVAWEFHSGSCGPSLRESKAGKVFLDVPEGAEFDVDEEGALDFLEFEAERKIKEHHRQEERDWTLGFLTYVQYGIITLASGQSSAIDSMMRRTQWIQRHNLHGQQTAEGLRARCTVLAESQGEMFV